MIEHLITAASSALGGASVVLVGYLGSSTRPFAQAVAALPPVAISRALAAHPVALEPAGNAIVLASAGATGVRRVRILCDQPGDQR